MDGIPLEPLLLELADYFGRHGMAGHVENLRRFWVRWKARTPPGPKEWSEEFVFEWLALARITPFDRVYPVRGASSICSKCGTQNQPGVNNVHVLATFPTGWLEECPGCRARWIRANGR